MTQSLSLARILFGALSVLFMMAYMLSYPVGSVTMRLITGVCLGGSCALLLLGIETFFKRFNLRSFNVAIVGLFFGYLMGLALTLVFNAVVQMSFFASQSPAPIVDILRMVFFLVGCYLGTILTVRFSEELHISIPFIRFTQSTHAKKDLILDLNALCDPRLGDFLSSGLLNHSVILPKFLIKELQQLAENNDEQMKPRVRKGLEMVKKLEGMKNLGLRISETDFFEIKDMSQKITRLARLNNANILTSETGRTQTLQADDTLFINLNQLSTLLKPLAPPGETISIKVQRYGKEPRQGVGYLEDGTMVVINNGGDFIGEQIDTQVISVKQTSAGRIIFTNAIDAYATNDSPHLESVPAYDHD